MEPKDKTLSDIIRTQDVEEFDRRLQEGLRKPGGAGEEIRQGNLIEQLARHRGVTISDAFAIAREPMESGETYLELCHTHEGWIKARMSLGLGRPADA